MVALAVALVGGGGLAVWVVGAPDAPERDLTGLVGTVERGAYVARLAGCIACHTDVKAGGAVLAGGAEIKTDFGRFFAPNITPDPEDGIGGWSLNDFSRALTAGLAPDGQHYFPSFPYAFYSRLTDRDIVDLWAAVQSVPAVSGGPPAHDLRFPFGVRSGVGLWKRLFFEPGRLEPIEGRSESWNRGRYLARGPAHCGACHTPRNLLGGRETGRRYAGAVGPGAEKIPPITPDALAAEGWAADDIVYALRSGIMPDGDVFGGAMAEVVRDGTRFWSDADLAALVEYILNPESQE